MVEPAPVSRVTVELTAVVVAVCASEPMVLVTRSGGAHQGTALPRGPLRPGHRTLQAGLRRWVEERTRLDLGYVEQLYTFGDPARPIGREDSETPDRTVSIAYLALVRDNRAISGADARWLPWYQLFPWEDWRCGEPQAHTTLVARLQRWAAETDRLESSADGRERLALTFGLSPAPWDDERALERYELLYEGGLVPEAWIDSGLQPRTDSAACVGQRLAADHRRMVATAISRLRAKIKYRPLLFEVMPETFTLHQLQQTAESLAGVRLHKQNFRRLVESQRLVEETGDITTETGGRPARLMRFRPEVILERPLPGVRLKATRRASFP